MLSFKLPVVLASSTSGDQLFFVIVFYADQHLIRTGDEREWLVVAWLVMTKSWGHS